MDPSSQGSEPAGNALTKAKLRQWLDSELKPQSWVAAEDGSTQYHIHQPDEKAAEGTPPHELLAAAVDLTGCSKDVSLKSQFVCATNKERSDTILSRMVQKQLKL